MNTDLEEIKSRLNIVDVLGGYIRLEKAGANWRANCPFHNEKTPSFMVSEDKQIWHCFGCQKGGDIFSFVMEMEGLEFRDALKLLAEKAGVQLQKIDPKRAEQKNKTLEILELATKFYQAHLWQTAGGKKILDYLHDRGIKDASIKEFRLGYAPDGWQNALNFLIKKGYSQAEIVKTGLLVESQKSKGRFYDRFRDRIMFPIADSNGKIVGYSARVAPGGDESQAKYVNTPETEAYHKSRILYGFDKAKAEIRSADSVLLVEGNMDVIASHQAGIKNTVAVSGTALTEDQINTIKRFTHNIKMFFDMDNAGEQATKKSIKLCFDKDMEVRVVKIPSGKDAAETAKDDSEKLKAAIDGAKNIMEYFFENIFAKYDKEDAAGRKMILNELLDKIGILKETTDKNYWIKKLAEKINRPGANTYEEEKALTDMLKKASLKDRVQKTSQSQDQKDGFAATDGKIETLIKGLTGLMLVYEAVWKEILERENLGFLPKDSLLNLMIQKGREFHFSFDELVKNLGSEDDVRRAEKIYFENRYRIGLDNKLEEVDLDDPLKEAIKQIRNIRYELNKEKLEKISKDLDIAKKNKDDGAVRFLGEECLRINQEQAVLNNELSR